MEKKETYHILEDDKTTVLTKKQYDQLIREAKIEVLTEIFQTCYQEDSKTRELVEEKLSKLRQ
ncbi:hypothetical protein GX830_00290 [Candidatus Dojkabacteria bacterium]|nr:hypothetical protein [Candidatus Dojkabacteria bacterium]